MDDHDGLGAEDAPAERKRVTRRTFVAARPPRERRSASARPARWAPARRPRRRRRTRNDDREFEGLVLRNGKIHTMDRSDRRRGRGPDQERPLRRGRPTRRIAHKAKVIDLKGRTVVPGLIEGHVHVVSLANRPGYHVVIENATNIAEHPGDARRAAAATSRRASSSPRWAAGARTSSPSAACRRSPSSTRQSPTGRSSSTRRRRPGGDEQPRQGVLRERIRRAGRPGRRQPDGRDRDRQPEPGEPRALPPAHAADVRGQEAQHDRRDGATRRASA